MSGAIVELVVLRLKEGVNVVDDGRDKTVLEENFAETNWRPGCHAIYMGIPEEQPDMLYLIAEWESLQAHKDWQNHPDYLAFMAKTFTLADPSYLRVIHFYLIPHETITSRASPFNAPVTQVSWNYYPDSYDTNSHHARYESNITDAAKVAPVQGMQGGWVIEDTEMPGTDGEKAKLFMEYNGWASTAEHLGAEKNLTQEGGVGVSLLKEIRSGPTVHVAFKWTSSSQWKVS